ncbi:amidohydrolase family protein [Candidatus Solirubrobacter pratensis]|uniref:amidohydrolase family protein n=1 Tax=Candidatus Solirubrobacter pratensis TaxID=1298857 RepID=UPI0004144B8C|nr:amidohydrolase family protein [Candidatus Solirubrobacter pratensis]
MRRADIHQHFWPEALLSSLARRTALPRIRHGLLELAGEPPSPVDPRDQDPGERDALAAADGLQRVLIAPSSPLGLESLPDAEALLDAFHAGVRELGPPFELWAGLVLADPSPERVDALLDDGAAGLCLPAGALSTAAGLHALGPALERLAARGAPLLIHPGPAAAADVPAWWPALNGYVAEMAAAWHAWAAWGRPQQPALRVVFAMLAGLAPLHAERLAARGGPAGAVHDALTAFDTSSYGPHAVDAMLRAVGVDRLLYGSDRPVVAPQSLASLGRAAEHAITTVNHEAFIPAAAWAS